MKRPLAFATTMLAALLSGSCGSEESAPPSAPPAASPDADGHADEEDHAHDETSLGTVRIGELEVELAQAHGGVAAGKESHLVVKLPASDAGSSIVRAWLGTQDRLGSLVGKGEYAPSHGDYDVHATAPDPLPADTRWWIEVERPDGSKAVGSAEPLLE